MLKTLHPIGNGIFSNQKTLSNPSPSHFIHHQPYYNHHLKNHSSHGNVKRITPVYLRSLHLPSTDLYLNSTPTSFSKNFMKYTDSKLINSTDLSIEKTACDSSLLMNGFLGNAPLPVMFVKALYDYEADDQTSLSFREGDIIQVITQLESGWWDGVIKGVRGWFPSNYCQIIRTSQETTGENPKGHETNVNKIEALDENKSTEEYEEQNDDNELDSERGEYSKLAKEGNRMIVKDQKRANFWIPQATSDGRLFYFNTETGESSTDLPFDSPLADENSHHHHQPHQNLLHSQDRSKNLSDRTQNSPEWRNQSRLTSDVEDTDNFSAPESGGEYLKVPQNNTLSRQRSHLADRVSPQSMESASEDLPHVRLHKEPHTSNPNTFLTLKTSSATLSLDAPHDLSPCSSLFDDGAYIPMTWDRLVINMKKAVERYRDTINKNERSSYVHRAEDISDHLRLLLAAGSGTTDNHSGQPSIISTNKALYPHFRDMMSKFSKLVISSHIAAADWPNAESHQKCLQEADRVLKGVLSYVEVARKQRGENLLRLLPGFIMGTMSGGSWKNNGLGVRDLPNPGFSNGDESVLEPLVPLDSNLGEHLDDLKRILMLQIRKLEENLTLTEKIITPAQHELIGNNICAAAKRIFDNFKQWILTVESINLSSLGNSYQNPQLVDFAALKQGLYDCISDLLMSCQAVASPLADEWAEIRGEPLEARLTHVRLCAKLLETKTSQVGFSLQLLGEQIQMAQAVPTYENNNGKGQESRKTDGVPFIRSHHVRNDSRIHSSKLGSLLPSSENDTSVGFKKAEKSKVRKFFGEDPSRRDQALPPRPEQPVVHIDETPDCLRLDHEDDISYDMKSQPPQLKGGTLVALVEQLTRHDKLDSNFNNTFLLTYRSFTTARDLFLLLVQRFQIQPPEGIAQTDYEVWRDRKQKPIRFRVVNILKSWLDNFWMEDQSEETKALIRDIYIFARDTVKTTETPGSTPLMSVLEQRLRGQDTTAKRLVLNMNQTTPPPIMPKNMKKLKFLDIDPTEFARQLTIIESKLYGKIKPTECLNKTWQKKTSDSDAEPAPNIKALILHSNQLTNWVAEIILTQLDVKKRVVAIKHFVMVADKCRQLNNYSTLTSIISALGTAPIHRLKRTWDQVPAKTLSVLESMRRLIGSTKNFGEYRESLHLANPPCLPFFGVYLTDLTFIEDGIPSIIKKSTLINFAKRAKTAEVIRDIQQYQNVPYALQPVPDLQDYILTKMQAAGDVHEMYEKSLAVEPREREDEKIVRVLAESGFL